MIPLAETFDTPYPGLRAFEETDSQRFFGRDAQIDELLHRLSQHRFVGVVGVSGSGKSSLVRAGLIPALRQGYVSRSKSKWRLVTMRPGEDPVAALSKALREQASLDSDLERSSHGLVIAAAKALSSDESLLVVVDQFEEVFRYREKLRKIDAAGRRERARAAERVKDFVQLLLEASASEDVSIYVVITMRSDYFGDCAKFRNLPEALNASQYLVPRMTREQRRDAIELPLGSVPIAPSLVQRLLNDAGDEPDQLPVLQHALMRTWEEWERRGGDQIEECDYETVGRFEGALNKHADQVFESLSEHEQRIAERVFKRLTAKGSSDRETRSPATLATLWAVCGASNPGSRDVVDKVVDRFRTVAGTFLTSQNTELTADSVIDITHESLIQRWDRLKTWVAEEAKSAKTYLSLTEDAKRWRNEGGSLLDGLDLRDAEKWKEQRNPSSGWALDYADGTEFGDLELVDQYISKSREEVQRRLARRQWIIAGLAGLVVAFGALTLTAALYSKKAKIETVRANDAKDKADYVALRLAQEKDRAETEKARAEKEKERADENLSTAQNAQSRAEDEAKKAEQARARADEQREKAEKLGTIGVIDSRYREALGSFLKGDRANAIMIFDEVRERYRALGLPEAEADTLYNIARAQKSVRDTKPAAVQRFRDALNIYERLQNYQSQANVLVDLGDTLTELNQKSEAAAEYQYAANISRAHNLTTSLISALEPLAKAFDPDQPQDALRCYVQLIALYEDRDMRDYRLEAATHASMAALYERIENFDNAVANRESAADAYRHAANRNAERTNLLSAARIVQRPDQAPKRPRFIDFVRDRYPSPASSGDPKNLSKEDIQRLVDAADIVGAAGEIELANEYYEIAIAARRATADPEGAANALNQLATLYRTVDPTKAFAYWVQAYVISAQPIVPSDNTATGLQQAVSSLYGDMQTRPLIDLLVGSVPPPNGLTEADQNRMRAVLAELTKSSQDVSSVYQSAVNEYRISRNLEEAAVTLASLGRYFRAKNLIEQTFASYQQEIDLYQRAGLPQLEVLALRRAGFFYYTLKRYGECEEAYLQAASVYASMKDNQGRGVSLSNLGGDLSDPPEREWKEKALKYSLEAYALLSPVRAGNESTINSLEMRIPSLYNALGMNDEATAFQKRIASGSR
jgi:tetratricopeptide (TPR) repeat protein